MIIFIRVFYSHMPKNKLLLDETVSLCSIAQNENSCISNSQLSEEERQQFQVEKQTYCKYSRVPQSSSKDHNRHFNTASDYFCWCGRTAAIAGQSYHPQQRGTAGVLYLMERQEPAFKLPLISANCCVLG